MMQKLIWRSVGTCLPLILGLSEGRRCFVLFFPPICMKEEGMRFINI